MQTVEALRAQIDTAESLHSVVKTMKALAAVSIRQLEGVVRSIDQYNRTIELGLQVVLRDRPEGVELVEPMLSDALGMVVLGSDQGMCGQFNEQIVSHAIDDMREVGVERGRRAILAVGARTVAQFENAGLAIDDLLAAPASVGSIALTVEQIALQIERWRTERGFDRIFLCYSRRVSPGRYRPVTHRLLPIDRYWLDRVRQRRWPTRVLPTFAMPWRPLFATLLQQHILVTISRAVVHAMMSEHTARLTSMQAAEKNIDERLDELQRRFRHTRQSAITAELLDIVAGFEALHIPHEP